MCQFVFITQHKNVDLVSHLLMRERAACHVLFPLQVFFSSFICLILLVVAVICCQGTTHPLKTIFSRIFLPTCCELKYKKMLTNRGRDI